MSTVNSSSASNSSCPLPSNCYNVAFKIFYGFNAVKSVFLLALGSVILYLGYQRWRQQRSFKTTSHSDIFTYNMVAMQLILFLGCLCYFWGEFASNTDIQIVAYFANSIFVYGEMFFHVLTCVERYLAVVHPVTYLRLKNVRGVTIRNISIGCAWVLSIGCSCVIPVFMPSYAIIQMICVSAISLVISSFCSLRVLCVLIRPGPGEVGGDRERVDQSKQRAFYTVTAITGVLMLWFAGLFVTMALVILQPLSLATCVISVCGSLINLPSNLVLPLLFLQRAGKLPSCRR